MSSTGRGRERQGRDDYPTPIACVEACVDLLDIKQGDRVLEPGAGAGHWVGPLAARSGRCDAIEINPDRYAELLRTYARLGIHGGKWRGDFTRYLPRRGADSYDWVVGNPPFTYAAEFIKHAHWLLRPGGRCAMLLGSGFLHTAGRRWLREQCGLWRDYGLEGRPPFMQAVGEDGTDSVEYSLFIHQKGYQGDATKRYFSWKDPAKAAADRDRIRRLDWAV